MAKFWRVDNDEAEVSRPGRQFWPVTIVAGASGSQGADAIRVEFEGEQPFNLPVEQARALGAKVAPSRPERILPGSFRHDPETGERLEPEIRSEPQFWTSLGSEDGLATSTYVDLDISDRQDFVFPARSMFAVAGAPPSLYAVHSELGVVYRWNTAAAEPRRETAWVRAGKVGECYLPVWSLGLAGGRHALVTPGEQGPEALPCPALSGRRTSDVFQGARCLAGAAERLPVHGPGEFLIPAMSAGRLTVFSRSDDPAAHWTASAVDGLEGAPPGDVLAAPVMDAARRVFWVGATGMLVAPEGEAPFWQHFEPGFHALRRARPYKDGGVLWQLGRTHGPEGEGFAFRKLTPGAVVLRPVANPHFSGGPLTYAAPDLVRRYRRPWESPEPDDMLRMTSDKGFLAPLVTLLGRANERPRVLLMVVESPVAAPFLLDDDAPRVAVGLQLHESLRQLSGRLDGGVLQGVEELGDVLAVIFDDRLFVLHRNHPHEFAPCVSWPVKRSR